MMKIPIYQVDAFTDQKFGGNPAAVCPLKEWLEDELMQQIAAENNLSETAFFVQHKDEIKLRWFTPTIEVDLCGHATLASAHVLFNHLNYQEPMIYFSSHSGTLTVKNAADLLVMNFPSRFPIEIKAPDELVKGLKVKPVKVLKDANYFAVFEDEQDVQNLDPDFSILAQIKDAGIICTAPGKDCDFVSRFFAPYAGINEDPVTGSAHSELTPYWSKQLGKKELFARQISQRGGKIFCKDLGERTEIAGNAITYLVGEIDI